VALLQVPRGHVIDAGEAEPGPARRLHGDVAEPLQHHHADLSLVLHLLRLGRQEDRALRRQQRRGGLEEDERLGREFVAQLPGVRQVVAADADDLARLHRDHTLAPMPCRAKKSSMRVRTSAQRPMTRSARGSPLSPSGPYRLVTTRLSSSTTAPTSARVRIRRPKPCFSLSAACGSRYPMKPSSPCSARRSSRAAVSGSEGTLKGNFVRTSARSARPGTSTPSQNESVPSKIGRAACRERA